MTEPHERPTFRQMLARDTDDGWECPRCGCRDWRVVDSRQFGDVRKRLRACRHCHQTIKTSEVMDAEAGTTSTPGVSIGSLPAIATIDDDCEHDDADDCRASDRTKRARA